MGSRFFQWNVWWRSSPWSPYHISQRYKDFSDWFSIHDLEGNICSAYDLKIELWLIRQKASSRIQKEISENSTHGLINYIDTKAKCSHLKIWPVKGLCGRCLSVWGPEPQHPPSLHTVYVYTVYLFTQRKGGGRLNQREGKRGNSSQSWVENTSTTDCISSL